MSGGNSNQIQNPCAKYSILWTTQVSRAISIPIHACMGQRVYPPKSVWVLESKMSSFGYVWFVDFPSFFNRPHVSLTILHRPTLTSCASSTVQAPDPRNAQIWRVVFRLLRAWGIVEKVPRVHCVGGADIVRRISHGWGVSMDLRDVASWKNILAFSWECGCLRWSLSCFLHRRARIPFEREGVLEFPIAPTLSSRWWRQRGTGGSEIFYLRQISRISSEHHGGSDSILY